MRQEISTKVGKLIEINNDTVTFALIKDVMGRLITCSILWMILLPGLTLAQGKYMFSGSLGYSIPLGNYSGLDTNNEGSGYARGGFMVQGSADRVGKYGVGFGLTYIFQSNPLDESVDSVMPDGHSFYLGDGSWNNHYILVGPSYFKTWDRFMIEASLRGGLILAGSSNFWVTLPAEDTLSDPRLSKGMGIGFGLQIKAGVAYRIAEKLFIQVGVNYLYGAPIRKKDYYGYTYVYEPEIGYVPVYYGSEFVIKKKVSSINPHLGILFKL